MAGKKGHRAWGYIRELKSGRFQASYRSPDDGRQINGLGTFETKIDAEGWLAAERRLVDRSEWTHPRERARQRETAADAVTVSEFAPVWLDQRARPLTPKTRAHYENVLESKIYPTLGGVDLRDVNKGTVAVWYAGLDHSKPTATAHAYQVLRALMNGAVEAEHITENPCQLKDAGKTPKRRNLDLLTADELAAVVDAMPDRYRAAVLVAAWGGLRFGELTELRRGDVSGPVLKIRRAVTFVQRRGYVVGKPKSAEGVRDVTLPPHVVPLLTEHMAAFTGAGNRALVFTTTRGERLTQSAFTKPFKAALREVGRPEVRVHDLRHFGAVAAARAGGTTKELMARLGHSTPEMSMRYQHAAAGRDAEIAALMSRLANLEE